MYQIPGALCSQYLWDGIPTVFDHTLRYTFNSYGAELMSASRHWEG